MPVQARLDISTNQILLGKNSLVKDCTIAQDAQRTADLLQNTVMAYDTTLEAWVPFTSLTSETGASVPQGIYLGDDIAAADLVAGDIENCEILIGDALVDENLVVWDQDILTAASIVPAAAANPYFVLTAEACLKLFGIFMSDTIQISEYAD